MEGRKDNAVQDAEIRRTDATTILLGESPQLKMLRGLIARVARTEVTVLITGETGTGKELIARSLHTGSSRHAGPFVAVNCAAIPHALLESELFGYEKGAFTGAVGAREGRLEAARGGTLFLDEIGDMPLEMQAKLLRVLQEKSFERVGSTKSIPLDCRIVAATHRDLQTAIQHGQFREDLFYRLNVMPMHVPPLRVRPADILPVVHHTAQRCATGAENTIEFDSGALELLESYDWPGNVRELTNVIERLSILHPRQVISSAELAPHLTAGSTPMESPSIGEQPVVVEAVEAPRAIAQDATVDLRQAVAEFEGQLIRRALDQSNGVVSRAAALLRLPRTTLVEKLTRMNNVAAVALSRECQLRRVPRAPVTVTTKDETWLLRASNI